MTSKTHNKTVAITGATGGIGKAVAHDFASRGFAVIAIGRNPNKLSALVEELEGQGHTHITGDLALVEENRRIGKALCERERPLDVLINIAGTVEAQRELTDEGHERTLATNLLGPITLTQAARPALLRANSPRVVFTISQAINFVKDLSPDDLASERAYDGFRGAYARSKAWLTVWALHNTTPEVPYAVVDPGGVKTAMTQDTAIPWFIRLLRPFIMRSPEFAAHAFRHAGLDAAHDQLDGGAFTPKGTSSLSERFRDPAIASAVSTSMSALVQ